MSGQTVHGSTSSETGRRTWNKEGYISLYLSCSICFMAMLEYAAKAKAKDDEERAIMQKKDEMIRKGIGIIIITHNLTAMSREEG